MNNMCTTAAFGSVPLLLKRPRPPYASSLQSTSVRCNLKQPSDPSLAKKVENYLLASEQTPGTPPDATRPSSQILPVSIDLLNYHARVASRRPNYHDFAARLYRRCIQARPSDGRAWIGLARIYTTSGDITAARSTYSSAVRASPNNPYVLQAWGVFEERSSNLQRAKDLFSAALRADSTHAPAWVALGLWYQRHEGDFSSARSAFRRGADADPSNYYIWHVWGVLEKSCRRYPRAREYFQRGVTANPYNAATYVVWGSLEDEVGNSKRAIRLFEKAHQASPYNIHAYLSHAVAADKIGDYDKARSLLKLAISYRPRDPAPRQALGLLQFRHGDVDSARRIFEKALDKNRKHTPTWHAWARMECSMGNHERARKLYQEAVWAGPRSPHVVRTWHSWAMMEMSLGYNGAARRYFAHGLDVDHRSVVLLTGVAELEAKEGNMARARESMEKCIRLEPWRLSMWRRYQQLEAMYGSTHRAQLVYERSVVIGQQVEERLKLSDPLPGDYQGSGMWIDALELPPDKSAFDSIGTRRSSVHIRRSYSTGSLKNLTGTTEEVSDVPKERKPKRRRSERNLKSLTSSPESETPSSMRTAFGF